MRVVSPSIFPAAAISFYQQGRLDQSQPGWGPILSLPLPCPALPSPPHSAFPPPHPTFLKPPSQANQTQLLLPYIHGWLPWARATACTARQAPFQHVCGTPGWMQRTCTSHSACQNCTYLPSCEYLTIGGGRLLLKSCNLFLFLLFKSRLNEQCPSQWQSPGRPSARR